MVVAAITEVAEAGMTMEEDIREEAAVAMTEISAVVAEDTKAAMAVVAVMKAISPPVEVDMMEAQEDAEAMIAASVAVEVMMAASVAVEAKMAAMEAVVASKVAMAVVVATMAAMAVVAASEVVEDIKEVDMAAEVVSSSPMKEVITEVVVEEVTLEAMDSMESHLEQHRKVDRENSITTSVEVEAASTGAVVSPTSNGNTKSPRARLTISELIVYFI